MGVRGLTTLLDNYQTIYQDFKFRKSDLVVDGSYVIQRLYYVSGLDQNHGGEYAAFKEQIERFIAALRTCEVTPYVVLDGGSHLTDRKLETRTKRLEDRIKNANQAAEEGEKMDILPPLVWRTVKQTLAQLEVPVAQCFGEADQEIAALASEWNCPVLSGDSDFFIFNLPAGLLPFCYFEWKNVKQNGSERLISCQRYHTSVFCKSFGIQQQLLSTFAVLAGNDYIKQQKIKWTQFAPSDSKTPKRLEGLLCWLKGFQQPQEALKAALELMGELSDNKAELLQNLSEGLKEYQLPSSSLKEFFLNGIAPPFPAVKEVETSIQQVPDWIRLSVMKGQLTPDVLKVLLLKRMSLSIVVGHKQSVNEISRPLRQVMYGLLLGGGESVEVTERDREGQERKFIQVKPICNEVTQRLQLSSLNEAKLPECLQVLLHALGVTEDTLSDLEPELHLPVAATCFWRQGAQLPTDMKLVEALLLGMTNKDVLRARKDLKAKDPNSKPDLDVAHAFNQWQVCLKDSIQLNQLLCFPLPEPDVARLYQGTLVHQLVNKLAEDDVDEFLKSNQSAESVKLYNKMLSIVVEAGSAGEVQNQLILGFIILLLSLFLYLIIS